MTILGYYINSNKIEILGLVAYSTVIWHLEKSYKEWLYKNISFIKDVFLCSINRVTDPKIFEIRQNLTELWWSEISIFSHVKKSDFQAKKVLFNTPKHGGMDPRKSQIRWKLAEIEPILVTK